MHGHSGRPLLAAVFGVVIAFASFIPVSSARTITDAIGRQVQVPDEVDRLVLGFYFEEFSAVAGVEGWRSVVGISRNLWAGWRPAIFNRYVPLIPGLATMPDVGNTEDGDFSAEKVIGLRPQVLLLPEWGYKSATTARQQIEQAGIAIVVIDFNAQTLERHVASTRAIGAVMGVEARAEELAGLYRRRYEDIMARVAKAKAKSGGAKPRAYVELGRDGAGVYGNSYQGTMWGHVLDSLGAENIANGRIPGPWGPLSAEAVIAADPQVVFIAGSSWVNRPNAVKTGHDATASVTRATLAPYVGRPGWSGLSAVRNGKIFAIEHGLGRAIYDFAAFQFIAKQLYPEEFADVDPERSLADFMGRYLPVPYSGTWMVGLRP